MDARREIAPATWLIASLAVALAAMTILGPPHDGEFGWQRFLADEIRHRHALPRAIGGESFTAAGAPWWPQEWAFALLVRATTTSSSGYIALAMLVASAAAAALLIAAATARRLGANEGAIFVCVGAAAVQMLAGYSLRAQMLVWPCLALLIRWMLLRGNEWKIVPLTVLWANLHGSAVLAPVLVAVAALGSLVETRRFDPETRRLTLVAAASACAACVTPLGIGLWQLAVTLELSPVHRYIAEWLEPTAAYPSVVVFLGLALAAAVFGTTAGGSRSTLPAATLCILALSAWRDLALAAIALVPYVAPAVPWRTRPIAVATVLSPDALHLPPSSRRRSWALAAVAAIAVPFALPLAGVRPDRWFGVPSDLAAVRHLPGRRTVYCANFAWCGYALAPPQERVFLDGRADAYPLAVWSDNAAIGDLAPAWEAILRRRGVNTIVLDDGTPLDLALSQTAGWRRVFRAHRSSVYVRDPARTGHDGRKLGTTRRWSDPRA